MIGMTRAGTVGDGAMTIEARTVTVETRTGTVGTGTGTETEFIKTAGISTLPISLYLSRFYSTYLSLLLSLSHW